jgi:hypothetical protein
MSARSTRDPAIFKLVEQQLRNWELAHSQRQSSPTPGEIDVEDFISVSRMVGVDGHLIATALGNQLGWPVFGREILDAMAGDDTIRQRIYRTMDERDLSWWEECLRGVLDTGFTRNDYFRRLCETVLSLARQSPSIFVGRGTDLVLPQDRGFRVRLTASAASRIRNHADSTGQSPERAAEDMEQVEHQRDEFLKHHFGIEAEDPGRHDLVVNLDRWSTAAAVKLILDSHALRITAGV